MEDYLDNKIQEQESTGLKSKIANYIEEMIEKHGDKSRHLKFGSIPLLLLYLACSEGKLPQSITYQGIEFKRESFFGTYYPVDKRFELLPEKIAVNGVVSGGTGTKPKKTAIEYQLIEGGVYSPENLAIISVPDSITVPLGDTNIKVILIKDKKNNYFLFPEFPELPSEMPVGDAVFTLGKGGRYYPPKRGS